MTVRRRRCPEIVLGDTVYELDRAYRVGARANRAGLSVRDNPHRDGSYAHDQWDAGHTHDAAGEHVRFGVDLIEKPGPATRTWEEDPDLPRDEHGNLVRAA